MPALTFKVGGDTSGLNRAAKKGRAILGKLATQAKAAFKGGITAGFVTAVAGATAALVGLKGALNLGSTMSDIAANTGLLAGEALVLTRAFEDAGVSGSKLQPTINKMQRSMVEAGEGLLTYKKAFDVLGVSLDEIRTKSPAEQFQEIQERLAAISDPTERAARAMQIFGRSGAELQALFSNGDALGNAKKSVGGAAEILNRDADSFDRAADLLNGSRAKLSGFFVGMASFITPVLLPVLEKLNSVDLAGYGRAAGRFVAVIAEGFRQGALPSLLKEGLLFAGKSLVNFLVKGFRGVVSGLFAALKNIPKIFIASMKILGDPLYWKSIGNILISSAKLAALAFTELLPDSIMREGNREAIDLLQKSHKRVLRSSGQLLGAVLKPYTDTLVDTGKQVGAAFAKEMRGSNVLDTGGNRQRISDTMDTLRKAVEANTKATEDDAKAVPVVPGSVESKERKSFTGIKPAITSLARVGGAALGSVASRAMDRERNDLLRKIERNTKAPGVAVFA